MHRVPRRRRGRAGEPFDQAADALLPRRRRGDQGRDPRPVRARRRDLHRDRRPPRLRRPVPAHPPGGVPRRDPGRAHAGVVRRVRPAGARTTSPSWTAPFSVRRSRLEEALASAADPIHVTRTTTDAAEAEEWFGIFEGAGLDGVVAKPLAKPYAPNGRHDAQDQARPHGRRRRGGLPAAQDLDRRAAAARVDAAGALRRRRPAAARRRRRVVHRGAPGRADRPSSSR